MGISIRDPKVGELARELASLRKTNMTEAIAHALRNELKRERDKRPLVERLDELAEKLEADGGTKSARGRRKKDIDDAVGSVIVHRHLGRSSRSFCANPSRRELHGESETPARPA